MADRYETNVGAVTVQEYADAAAAALDLLRAEDFPFTERVDRLAEMCAAWLKAADAAVAAPAVAHPGCPYLAPPGSVCNKCGTVVASQQEER